MMPGYAGGPGSWVERCSSTYPGTDGPTVTSAGDAAGVWPCGSVLHFQLEKKPQKNPKTVISLFLPVSAGWGIRQGHGRVQAAARWLQGLYPGSCRSWLLLWHYRITELFRLAKTLKTKSSCKPKPATPTLNHIPRHHIYT